jgi:Ca2+-binding RTX toxin-like protein
MGGAGTDTVTYATSPRPVSVDLGQGLSYDGAVFDQLVGIENAIGSNFNDLFQGQVGLTNRFDGGAGIDTVSYAASSQAVSIDLGQQLTYDGTAFDVLNSIENAIGSNFNDTLQGQVGVTNRLDGGAGTDTVSYAASSRSVIIDLAAQATFDGLAGDTLVSIENAIGSNFNDQLQGAEGTANILNGGAGSDTVFYSASTRGVSINLATQSAFDGTTFDTLVSIENATGSNFNDTLFSDASANRLDGGTGIDTVSYAFSTRGVSIDLGVQLTYDGVSLDTLNSIENAVGSNFNDTLQGSDSINNRLDGGAGIDTVSYTSSVSSITAFLSDSGDSFVYNGSTTDTLSSIENVQGTRFDDAIYGNSFDNVLDGGPSGSDSIYGGAGIDTVSYASITSASGVYVDLDPYGYGYGIASKNGGTSQDFLSSIENITGSKNADTLIGNSVANVINGGAGADSLTGRGGFDTFVFNAREANGDRITDFAGNGAAAGDQLELVGYGTAAQGANIVFNGSNGSGYAYTINSADGTIHDTITLSNFATLATQDYHFS